MQQLQDTYNDIYEGITNNSIRVSEGILDVDDNIEGSKVDIKTYEFFHQKAFTKEYDRRELYPIRMYGGQDKNIKDSEELEKIIKIEPSKIIIDGNNVPCQFISIDLTQIDWRLAGSQSTIEIGERIHIDNGRNHEVVSTPQTFFKNIRMMGKIERFGSSQSKLGGRFKNTNIYYANPFSDYIPVSENCHFEFKEPDYSSIKIPDNSKYIRYKNCTTNCRTVYIEDIEPSSSWMYNIAELPDIKVNGRKRAFKDRWDLFKWVDMYGNKMSKLTNEEIRATITGDLIKIKKDFEKILGLSGYERILCIHRGSTSLIGFKGIYTPEQFLNFYGTWDHRASQILALWSLTHAHGWTWVYRYGQDYKLKR